MRIIDCFNDMQVQRVQTLLNQVRPVVVQTLTRVMSAPNLETARRAATTLSRMHAAPLRTPCAPRATDSASAPSRCSPSPMTTESATDLPSEAGRCNGTTGDPRDTDLSNPKSVEHHQRREPDRARPAPSPPPKAAPAGAQTRITLDKPDPP